MWFLNGGILKADFRRVSFRDTKTAKKKHFNTKEHFNGYSVNILIDTKFTFTNIVSSYHILFSDMHASSYTKIITSQGTVNVFNNLLVGTVGNNLKFIF